MALSYELEGTPATEESDAVGDWQGYLMIKIACSTSTAVQHNLFSELSHSPVR